jgi:hypothetical protein
MYAFFFINSVPGAEINPSTNKTIRTERTVGRTIIVSAAAGKSTKPAAVRVKEVLSLRAKRSADPQSPDVR